MNVAELLIVLILGPSLAGAAAYGIWLIVARVRKRRQSARATRALCNCRRDVRWATDNDLVERLYTTYTPRRDLSSGQIIRPVHGRNGRRVKGDDSTMPKPGGLPIPLTVHTPTGCPDCHSALTHWSDQGQALYGWACLPCRLWFSVPDGSGGWVVRRPLGSVPMPLAYRSVPAFRKAAVEPTELERAARAVLPEQFVSDEGPILVPAHLLVTLAAVLDR